MAWRVVLVDEDHDEYKGQYLYDSQREAHKDLDNCLESNFDEYIEDKLIIGGYIEKA